MSKPCGPSRSGKPWQVLTANRNRDVVGLESSVAVVDESGPVGVDAQELDALVEALVGEEEHRFVDDVRVTDQAVPAAVGAEVAGFVLVATMAAVRNTELVPLSVPIRSELVPSETAGRCASEVSSRKSRFRERGSR